MLTRMRLFASWGRPQFESDGSRCVVPIEPLGDACGQVLAARRQRYPRARCLALYLLDRLRHCAHQWNRNCAHMIRQMPFSNLAFHLHCQFSNSLPKILADIKPPMFVPMCAYAASWSKQDVGSACRYPMGYSGYRSTGIRDHPRSTIPKSML